VNVVTPVDLIRAHQRELFCGIPIQVSNEEVAPPLLTAPDWSGHDVPRTQLVWRTYPWYTLSVNQSDEDNEGNVMILVFVTFISYFCCRIVLAHIQQHLVITSTLALLTLTIVVNSS